MKTVYTKTEFNKLFVSNGVELVFGAKSVPTFLTFGLNFENNTQQYLYYNREFVTPRRTVRRYIDVHTQTPEAIVALT